MGRGWEDGKGEVESSIRRITFPFENSFDIHKLDAYELEKHMYVLLKGGDGAEGEERVGRARLGYLSSGTRVPSYAAVNTLFNQPLIMILATDG